MKETQSATFYTVKNGLANPPGLAKQKEFLVCKLHPCPTSLLGAVSFQLLIGKMDTLVNDVATSGEMQSRQNKCVRFCRNYKKGKEDAAQYRGAERVSP